MRTRSLVLTSAGLWASAAAAELFAQWRLLSPPLTDYFGTPLVLGLVTSYAALGGALGLVTGLFVRARRVGLMLLVFFPLFVGFAGILAPNHGLRSTAGFFAMVFAGTATVFLVRYAIIRIVVSSAWSLCVAAVLIATVSGGRVIGSKLQPPLPAEENAGNIVLVTIDTLRPDHVGLHGYARKTSPGLDSLAADGVVFTEAYAPMPCTAPSHATIMTGKLPRRHGVLRNGWSLPKGMATLAEILQNSGYRTGAFVGAAHLAAAFGWERGFDRYGDQGWFDQLFPYSGLRLTRVALRPFSPRFSRLAGGVVDDALSWLETHATETFFLWIHLWDPHDPYEPPLSTVMPTGGIVSMPQDSKYPGDRIRRWIRGYDGEISYVDRELGRLWQALRDMALSEQTTVVVVSDHGESLGERSFRGHSILLYEEQIKVLCMVVSPSLSHHAGSRIHQPVSLTDIAPTVLEIAGIDGGLQDSDGRSLVPLARGAVLPTAPVLMESNMWGFAARAVRYGNKKLVIHDKMNRSHPGFAAGADPAMFGCRVELFDLSTDPGEGNNLAEVLPDTVRMLERVIEHMLPVTSRGRDQKDLPYGTLEALRELGYVE